jgi:hypothetical protein
MTPGRNLAMPEHTAERERLAAEIADLKDALRRHTFYFDDSKGERLCGGCLRPHPCPDRKLAKARKGTG